MSGRPHPPSQMRAIMQDWKHGRAARELLPQARSIEDPSFAAEALFALATDKSLDAKDAEHAALEALRFVDKVERDWRRGEALSEMGKRLPDLRRNHPDPAPKLQAALVDRILGLPAKPRADAMRLVAGHLDQAELPRLMARALASEEEPFENGKAILKAAVESGAAQSILQPIRDSLDQELRLRMLGAWSSRMASTQPEPAGKVLGEVMAGLPSLPDPVVRIDILRAVVAASEDVQPLQVLQRWAAAQDNETAARILSATGARADKLGRADLAGAWLREAQAKAEEIPDEKARNSVRRNIHEGLKRMGVPASELPETPELARPKPPASAEPQATTKGSPSKRQRHVLALVDTYEGGLSEVHLRAVARAAPLCDAFDLDLALIGFPIKDAATFVKRAGRETNIGEGRGSLESLHKEGRLHLVPATTTPGEMPNIASLGIPVATSPDPDPAKATDFETAAALGKLCVLVGLGPKGLPESIMKAVAAHVELTGKKVSLETATAMGVIAERMRNLA